MGLLHLLVLVVGGSLIDIFIRSTFRVGYCDLGLGLGGYACCGVSVGVCVCVGLVLLCVWVCELGVGGWYCGVSVGAGVGLYCAVSVGVGIDVGIDVGVGGWYCGVSIGIGVGVDVGVGVPGLLDFMQVGHIDILQLVDSQ